MCTILHNYNTGRRGRHHRPSEVGDGFLFADLMSENDLSKPVPRALRAWFVIHFAVDMLFAVPLMLIPQEFLSFLGWQTVDPIAARLVAAALFGIGIESYLGRDASLESYRGMLNLKIIWSLCAVIGTGVSMLQGAQGRPFWGWMLLGVFAAFNILWVYWRVRISNAEQSGA